MSQIVGKPTPGDSALSKVAGMSSQDLPGRKNTLRAVKRSTKSTVPPNPAPPRGHCWYFCGSGCKWGSRCYYKHDEAVRKAIHEKKAAITPPKPRYSYAQAASKPVAEQNYLVSTQVITPKPQKAVNPRSCGQYLTPPTSPNDAKHTSSNSSKNPELTPPSTPRRESNQSWDIQTIIISNAFRPAKAAETGVWDVSHCHSQIDDITTQVFEKIYSSSCKLPHLTTKSRRSPNENIQTLSEIAEAALKYAQKNVVGSDLEVSQPNGVIEKSVIVKAGECYKKALSAGKIVNVLNKTEHAHLDVLIASQHWNTQLPGTNDTDTTPSASQVSKSATNHPQGSDTVQQSGTRASGTGDSWGNREYLAWARCNLTDATAIKLARTYCDSLQNGTAPKHLLGNMGKKAPPGTLFEYFSFLPYELREQIWLLALKEEKNDVRLTWHHAEKDSRFTRNCLINANNQQRLLFVNRELRELALKHNYELAFGTHYSPPKTYFDFTRDRLFLHSRSPSELPGFVRCIRTKDADRVQNLAIPLRDFVQGNEHKIAEALCKFKNVKRIHLVCGNGIQDVSYCGAGDARLAKKIERFFYGVWRKHNDPKVWPKIRMYTLPAIVAHDFKIDNMLF